MQSLGHQSPAKQPKQRQGLSALAQAMVETEREQYQDSQLQSINPFAEALRKSSSSSPTTHESSNSLLEERNQDDFEEQLIEKQKKEQLRKKLHDQVNPVDQVDVYNLRKQQTEKEIEAVRKELRLLADEVAKYHQEVQVTLMTTVVDPGQEGTYYKSFFQQLKAFIIMLRQQVHSQRTWARQAKAMMMKKKRTGSRKAVLDFDNNETKAVHDTLHHERSSSFGGV